MSARQPMARWLTAARRARRRRDFNVMSTLVMRTALLSVRVGTAMDIQQVTRIATALGRWV